MERQVRGFLFVDYVRMIRSHKQIPWRELLHPDDLVWISQRITLEAWYPMESYERLGLAILDHVAKGNLARIRRWGKATVDILYEMQPDVFKPGDPRETLARFDVLGGTLFNWPAARTTVIRDGKACVDLDYGMSPRAEEAACHQSLGFLERLLERAGADGIKVRVVKGTWAGDPNTEIEVTWTPLW